MPEELPKLSQDVTQQLDVLNARITTFNLSYNDLMKEVAIAFKLLMSKNQELEKQLKEKKEKGDKS